MESLIEKYPKPQKDGWETIYKDGTRLFGSWAHRLREWRNLINQ